MAQLYCNTAVSNSAVLVMSTGGQLAFLNLFNPAAATTYLQVFDAKATANVTVGTTTPTLVFGLTTLANDTPVILDGDGLQFGNGIVIAATTTATGNTAPATAMVVNIGYRAA